jgi:predicted TIM-barrel fold metal-dependent hydrolase
LSELPSAARTARLVALFGVGRCMFASNYPPDLKVR